MTSNPKKRSLSAIGGTFVLGRHSPKKPRASTSSQFLDNSVHLRHLETRLQHLTTPGSGASLSNNEDNTKPILTNVLQPLYNDTQRRSEPNGSDVNKCAAWKAVLPSLFSEALSYYATSSGLPIREGLKIVDDICPGTCTHKRYSRISALYFGHTQEVEIRFCGCRSLSQALVRVGLFPSAPSQPRIAFSMDLLDFYSALFDRSSDAVTAFSAALNAFYMGREFNLLNSQGRRFRDPFRRGLGHAAQWLHVLHVLINEASDRAIASCDEQPTAGDEGPDEYDKRECSRLLRNLCPACFGLDKFGRSLAEGADIHVATDGNFQHKHLVSGGRGMPTHELKQIIPKSFVDSVGASIEQARKAPPRRTTSKALHEAINGCESSYSAAQGEQKRDIGESPRYDSLGWMALTCRHDVPLALVDIDTPGEKQKYAISLLLWLFDQLPPSATVVLLYDIGCVLNRSVNLYDILPAHIVLRLRFATSILHSYGHHWACQLVHNPRFMQGLGLSDGEGVERTWSKLRMLIVIVRAASLAKRAFLTEHQVCHIAATVMLALGEWINKRERHVVVDHESSAQAVLRDCPLSIEELREQWELQKAAQSSPTTSFPETLKTELKHLLSLRNKIEELETAVEAANATISETGNVEKSLTLYSALIKTFEDSYAALNIQIHFPELAGLDPHFVVVLLLARDLKSDIRKRAIQRFFELDRLNRAAGGKNGPLGTKLHQFTRKSLTQRQKTLQTAITKYNQHCNTLKRLYKPSYNIPLPNDLPAHLSDLRACVDLLQDTWVKPFAGAPPRWLTCARVRAGIQAMLKLDRCKEERSRLDMECDNMIRWFTREMKAVQASLVDPQNEPISFRLLQRRTHLFELRNRWSHALQDSHSFRTRMSAVPDGTSPSPSSSDDDVVMEQEHDDSELEADIFLNPTDTFLFDFLVELESDETEEF